MIVTESVKNQKGLWVFIAPVNRLILSPDTCDEITINKITFVSSPKMLEIKKELNLSIPIEDFKQQSKIWGDFFDNQTFAIWKIGGHGGKKKIEFLDLVRQELDIISLSQLMYGQRKSNACISLSSEKQFDNIEYLMIHQNKSFSKDSFVAKDPRPLILDKHWNEFQSFSFFFELLNVLKGKSSISRKWQCNIASAGYLAGQSQASTQLPQAFLWNMIAIETLLTCKDDNYSSELPLRAEAFIGWTQEWSDSDFSEKIKNVYKKRCRFVHCGKIDTIESQDLEFTDELVYNIFLNILKHLNLFKNKSAIIEFSKQIQNGKISGKESIIRPITLQYAKRHIAN